jgi:phosphoribosyl-dephospho-CoA transferase
MTPRAHDLLWITRSGVLDVEAALPPWASTEWMRVAPVVVRRERCSDSGRIPIGLRGAARNQRCKAYLERQAIANCLSPEMLVASASWRRQRLGVVPALEALAALTPALDRTGLTWGPTGSVGFALASGLPVLHRDSDLDLLVRAPYPLTHQQMTTLLCLTNGSLCPIDIQIDTGCGAFALAEWGSGVRRVLVKTDTGPLLCSDPWCLESAS